MTDDGTSDTGASTDELSDIETAGDGDGGVLDSMGRRAYVKSAAATAAVGLGVGAATAQQQTITSNQTGTHDGYFYSFWTNDEGSVSMTLESGGSYSCEWNNTGNFVLGKGWETGSARTIDYSADYNPQGNSYLCLYGWTTDPLVEYYIIEDYGSYKPGDESHGTHTTDGSTYEIYTSERVEQPSIEGTATFPQYWSIRTNSRTSGTITTSNHFDAWQSAGLDMGSHDYQILATEGYQSSGSSSVTVGSTGGTTGGTSGGTTGGSTGGSSGGTSGGSSGGSTGGTGGDLIAEIDPSTTSASVGDLVQFHINDTSGSGNWITSLEWDLGNGSTGTGWYADQRYQSAGSYTVTLTATNNEGASSTDEVTVDIS